MKDFEYYYRVYIYMYLHGGGTLPPPLGREMEGGRKVREALAS